MGAFAGQRLANEAFKKKLARLAPGGIFRKAETLTNFELVSHVAVVLQPLRGAA